jgi:hypothetical protein
MGKAIQTLKVTEESFSLPHPKVFSIRQTRRKFIQQKKNNENRLKKDQKKHSWCSFDGIT